MKHTLRNAALARGLWIGAAADPEALCRDADYAGTLSSQFSMLTPENVMKAGVIHPQEDRFEFAPADALVDFAWQHDMKVRGHTLVWHGQLPEWLEQGVWSEDGWRRHLESHIRAVVGRYRGRVAVWDVVNEAVEDDGGLRDTHWLGGLGPSYLESAFRIAHEEDPAARLFYNDYGAEGMGVKSDAVYRLMRDLLEKDVPVHGVGMQMHVSPEDCPPLNEVAENMERLAGLGLEVHITEMDVRLRQPAEQRDLLRQAEVYEGMLDVCLSASNCTAFVMWGFTDKYSWVPGYFRGWGDALVFDAGYRPKPAFHALRRRLVDADAMHDPPRLMSRPRLIHASPLPTSPWPPDSEHD